MIGKVFPSKNFGEMLVIGKGRKPYHYRVKFLTSGGELEFRRDQILSGEVYDKYSPTVAGVGYLGDMVTKKHQRLYNIWRAMITRCYNKSNPNYPRYGERGVTVDKRWHCFKSFVEDSTSIDGWNEDEFNNGNLQLDKDIKQFHDEKKTYSLETCTWIGIRKNAKVQPSQQNYFVATSPDGEEFISHNITDFARKHELERKQISAVLHGRFKTHLGWKFRWLEG